MTYSDKYGTFFGRLDEHGNVAVLHVEDGLPATRLADSVYPILYSTDRKHQRIGSRSVRYEYRSGIVLTPRDAARLGIEVET
jgi:hypothetical protein